jgi:hypothetical protein
MEIREFNSPDTHLGISAGYLGAGSFADSLRYPAICVGRIDPSPEDELRFHIQIDQRRRTVDNAASNYGILIGLTLEDAIRIADALKDLASPYIDRAQA